MILTCPECATRYLTKDGSIGPNGRTVRCTKCETTWFVASDMDELALKDNQVETITAASVAAIPSVDTDKVSTKDRGISKPELGAHVDIRDRADNLRRKRRLRTVALIWLIPLLILCFAVGLAYKFRQDIVSQWPMTATLYKQLGVKVSISGLEIEDPITRNTLIENKTVLVVNGAVRNISTKAQDVPLIKFSLHSESGQELTSWFVDTDVESLEKKGRVTFVSEYPNPPLDAVALRYRFEDSSGVLSEEGGETPQTFKR